MRWGWETVRRSAQSGYARSRRRDPRLLAVGQQRDVCHPPAIGAGFCAGDAIHRHPPSNGLGSNTSIQDSYNLAWKLAAVLRGQAAPSLLDTYSTERAPVARQIVLRANKSSREFVQFFDVLGVTAAETEAEMIEASTSAS